MTQTAARVEPSVVAIPAHMTEAGLPDLRGMGAREALRELARLGLSARMQGTGVVVDQHPPAGAPLEAGATCTLVLSRVLARPAGALGDQR
jgi:beta-lactam-binding protein with PASTA domain